MLNACNAGPARLLEQGATGDPAASIRPVDQAAERASRVTRVVREPPSSAPTARDANILHGNPDLDDTITRQRANCAAVDAPVNAAMERRGL